MISGNKLIIHTGLLVALCSGACYALCSFLLNGNVSFTEIILVTTLVFIISSACNYFSLKKNFFSVLRKIHSDISQITHSIPASLSPKIPDHKLPEEINRILLEWEKNKKQEIDQLKKMEVYRRDFLGNVSHELKTPIFNVQGYLHTLIDGGIDDHEVNIHYLNKASRSLDRLISIVEDLESISKLEAGRMIIEPRIFDIVDLAREVFEAVEMQARDKQIKLVMKESRENTLYVVADKERIRQVLINLVVNSIKYGKENGQTEIRFNDNGEQVVIEVADDGIGIEKEHLPRLFERFYRVDKSRSREQGGTGLGLAIVKHIIEAHNQRTGVTSEPGVGSIFFFTLQKSK